MLNDNIVRQAVSKMLFSIKTRQELTDQQLANKIGISRSSLHNYYQGTNPMRLTTAMMIFKSGLFTAKELDQLIEEVEREQTRLS